MKSFRWTATKLMIFTLVTIVVTGWLASVIGNFHPFSDTYNVRAEFTDATGLLLGDVVKASGVDVGRVEDIEIKDGLAIVTMSLEDNAAIPANVEANIRFRNLLGQRMIVFEEGEVPTDEVLSDGALIELARTDPAFDLTVLFNGLRPLLRSTDPEDINIVSRALGQALRGRSDEVEAFLGNIASISDSIANKDQELSELLSNVNIVTADLASRDEQLRRTLANINDFLGDIEAGKEDLAEALVTLDDAATRLGRVVKANDENIEQELADLATILDAVNDKRADLRAAVRSLPDLLVAVERTNSYGEWGMLHLVHVCKDDFGTCGRRAGR
jgi:phospholipid/cholesterol/gamma-HCH transport system substrate-binding protein